MCEVAAGEYSHHFRLQEDVARKKSYYKTERVIFCEFHGHLKMEMLMRMLLSAYLNAAHNHNFVTQPKEPHNFVAIVFVASHTLPDLL